MAYSYFILVVLVACVASTPSVILPCQSIQASSFSSSDLTDMRLQSLGLSPSHFCGTDLFKGPRAGLTVAISGLTSPPTGLSALSLLRTPLEVPTTDATSELALILHGTDEKLRHATAADILAQTYDGASLTVSVSLDHEMAELMAVDSSIIEVQPTGNNFVFAWDNTLQAFDELSGSNNKLELNGDIKQLISWLNIEGAQIVLSGDFVQFDGIELDLRNKAESRFFAELSVTAELVQQVSSNLGDLVDDSAADSYSFVFMGLEEIRRRYGVSSAKFRSSMKLVDMTVSRLQTTLEQMYGSIDAQIILLDDSQTLLPRAVHRFQQLDTNTTTNYTYQQVSTYQISLWTGVMLFLAILLTFLMTHCMEINKDSILYRSTQSINFS